MPTAIYLIFSRALKVFLTEIPFLDFTSGYVKRALPILPKQGDKAPWRLYQNYALDILTLRYGSVVDRTMQFS